MVVPRVRRPWRTRRYHGSILAPWPNRVDGGKYRFGGQEFHLPVNEAGRNNALHGFSAGKDWELLRSNDSSIELGCTVGGTVGYPWSIELRTSYSISPTELSIEMKALNRSVSPAPFGCGFHPYFQMAGKRESWSLHVPAKFVMLVDSDRLLPQGVAELESPDVSFPGEGSPDIAFLDHAYGGFGSPVRAILRSVGGAEVTVKAPPSSPWLQVHAPLKDRRYSKTLVIEPMTCPPDAFNSSLDLISLEPEAEFMTEWTIALTRENVSA